MHNVKIIVLTCTILMPNMRLCSMRTAYLGQSPSRKGLPSSNAATSPAAQRKIRETRQTLLDTQNIADIESLWHDINNAALFSEVFLKFLSSDQADSQLRSEKIEKCCALISTKKDMLQGPTANRLLSQLDQCKGTQSESLKCLLREKQGEFASLALLSPTRRNSSQFAPHKQPSLKADVSAPAENESKRPELISAPIIVSDQQPPTSGQSPDGDSLLTIKLANQAAIQPTKPQNNRFNRVLGVTIFAITGLFLGKTLYTKYKGSPKRS